MWIGDMDMFLYSRSFKWTYLDNIPNEINLKSAFIWTQIRVEIVYIWTNPIFDIIEFPTFFGYLCHEKENPQSHSMSTLIQISHIIQYPDWTGLDWILKALKPLDLFIRCPKTTRVGDRCWLLLDVLSKIHVRVVSSSRTERILVLLIYSSFTTFWI